QIVTLVNEFVRFLNILIRVAECFAGIFDSLKTDFCVHYHSLCIHAHASYALTRSRISAAHSAATAVSSADRTASSPAMFHSRNLAYTSSRPSTLLSSIA